MVRAQKLLLGEDQYNMRTARCDNSTILSTHDKKQTSTAKRSHKAPKDIPQHIAFICDGNSRWAELNSLPKSIGHTKGSARVIDLISSLTQRDVAVAGPGQRRREFEVGQSQVAEDHYRHIQYCTFFVFSTENWLRQKSETDSIFKLIEKVAIRYQDHDAVQNGRIRIEVIGDINDHRIPEATRNELNKLQSCSRVAAEERRVNEVHHDILTVCLAINYGGRADILQAAAALAESIVAGEVASDCINEKEISKRLLTSNIPDPDLIIRTGGEKRLSNFLLWNAAYAEIYFSDILWPDFDEKAMKDAIIWYQNRDRRFGGRKEKQSIHSNEVSGPINQSPV